VKKEVNGYYKMRLEAIKIFLLVLFIQYYFNLIYYQHFHWENNQLVVHSHPYKDLGHHHSSTDFQTIRTHISFSVLPFEPAPFLTNDFPVLKINLTEKNHTFIKSIFWFTFSLRGPPVLS
jgi:hypothetical protein